MKNLRVLIVEDSDDDSELIKIALTKGGYDVIYDRVDNAKVMTAALDRDDYDLVLSDHSMPKFNSREALGILRRTNEDMPFILVSGKIGETDAVELMKAGASDYVSKNHLALLPAAVERALDERDAFYRRKQADAELLKQSERNKLLLSLYEKTPELEERDLFNYFLDQVVSYTESTVGFFHRVAKDQKNIILTTWNEEAKKGCTVTRETHYAIEKAGNWVDSLRLGHTVIYNDYVSSPNQKGLPTGHFPIKSFMSVPITDNGECRYIFGVGNKVAPYNESDAVVVQQIAEVLMRIVRQRQANKVLIDNEKRLRKTLAGTVNALSAVGEHRDPYTAGHQDRTTDLACAIAEEMALSPDVCDDIRVAGKLHDIGKIEIPSEILSKPGKLTDIEYSMIQVHSQAGYDILRAAELPNVVARIVLEHHERLDGSGYPTGLKADKICVEARIMAVADVVEAMRSHRPYRPALGIQEALDEIEDNKGILYDPDVVDACLKLFRQKGFDF
jgi:putative nucleotidyltransferase with HDIG domain